MDRWFPVARSAELVPRHIAQTQLLGQEIALWRADTGAINAWENRCPHRGVRLSIGDNAGNELRCQYHAWRFASGSGQCTFIPAHPTQRPASGIRAGVYAAIERYQFVWVNLDPHTVEPHIDEPDLHLTETERDATLRSIFVNAPTAAVRSVLLQGYQVDATTEASVVAADAFTLTANTDAELGEAPAIVFLLQPVTETQTIIHGLLQPAPPPVERLATLFHHNTQMSALRNAAEKLYAAVEIPAPLGQRAPC
jgi:nitrite reductase/ring-hydroxylating ferredoxin subunit